MIAHLRIAVCNDKNKYCAHYGQDSIHLIVKFIYDNPIKSSVMI